MSPKKITDTDKLEISRLYRQSEETTASLASRYGVSNSTISRLLKNTIPEAEYEDLIQQKRGVKIAIEDKVATIVAESNSISPSPQPNSEPVESNPSSLPSPVIFETQLSLNMLVDDVEKPSPLVDTSEVASPLPAPTIAMDTTPITENLGTNSRRVRRRSSAPSEDIAPPVAPFAIESALSGDGDRSAEIVASVPLSAASLDLDSAIGADISAQQENATITAPVPRIPILRHVRSQPHESTANLTDPDRVEIIVDDETDEDVNQEDVSVLAAMFGEEIADGEEEFDEEEDDEEDDDESPYQQLDRDRLLTIDRLHLQVTPLSQATLPRTCYIVIDKFAELIVRPLKDFADLGQIPGEEVQQRTLPIFDNHRVAKRFSNQRTQRVIKVPDSKIFHKTTHHLRSKGITRLLIDGNIYSLN